MRRIGRCLPVVLMVWLASAVDLAAGWVVDAGPDKILLGETVCSIQGRVIDEKGDGYKGPVLWRKITPSLTSSFTRPEHRETDLKDLSLGLHRFVLEVRTPEGEVYRDELEVEVREAPSSRDWLPLLEQPIQIMGRSLEKDGKLHMGFSGVSCRFKFKGSSFLMAEIHKGWGGDPKAMVIVDGDVENARVIHIDAHRKTYVLAEGLSLGEHRIEVVRLSGAWDAAMEWRAISVAPGASCLPWKMRYRSKILFLGDSITEGTYWPKSPGVNAHGAYAMTAGRLLQAETHLVAKSGIGLVKGYVQPQTLGDLMPRVLPHDQHSRWEVSQFQADVVVLNIGQNDEWTWGQSSPILFVDAYVKLLSELREDYPKAHLCCAMGSMSITKTGSPWPSYLKKAVDIYQKQSGDDEISSLIFRYQGDRGHPNAEQAKVNAELLVAHLQKMNKG